MRKTKNGHAISMGRRREGTDLRSHLRGERAATEWESRRESDKDTWSQESQSRRLMFGKGGPRPKAQATTVGYWDDVVRRVPSPGSHIERSVCAVKHVSNRNRRVEGSCI